MSSAPLPRYDELPARPGAPPGSSWGVWGDGDVFGCLNLLTPERAVAAASLVRRGAVFAMNLDMDLPGPPLFNRAKFAHEVTNGSSGISHDDVLSNWNTQSSSQWDGFRHIAHPEHGHYGGVADGDHGVHHWAQRGLVGRALLVDVGRWRAAQGRPLQYDQSDPIEPADLMGAIDAQGVPVEPGDVLLMRTGWVNWYRGLSIDKRSAMARDGFSAPGLAPTEETARTLWDLHIAAIGVDNPAVEVWPYGAFVGPEETQRIREHERSRFVDIFVHVRLLPLLGLPLGELWDLEPLADDCAVDGRYTGLFTSAPLNLPSGVASPPNALVIK